MQEIIARLLTAGKGILAMDASNPTMVKRMGALGIASTPGSRRDFRELLVTTAGLGEFVSGAILYDETIHQKLSDGRNFVEALESLGIVPGIKVDKGTAEMANFPGEKIAQGLDGLRERLSEYKKMGALFSKFRTVIAVGKDIPSRVCLQANAEIQARYVALSQEAGLVPIAEPEVLMAGDHSMEKCEEITRTNLKIVFLALEDYRVDLSKLVLKTNMVLPGEDSSEKHDDKEIAQATSRVLKETVPRQVPGVVFLSGGDSPVDVTNHLNAIAKKEGGLAWEITFSFERALEGPAMEAWRGEKTNTKKAQGIFLERARVNSLASDGKL